MKWLKPILALMLAWGSTTAVAKPDPDIQTVKSWMAHLNSYYGDLKVQPRRGANGAAMLRDLEVLQEVLNDPGAGQAPIEDGALVTIACARAVCGDNPNGPCHTCAPF